MTKAQNFKEQSLANLQELAFGKETIPIASCSENGNPYILSRCSGPKIYDNKSNVTPIDGVVNQEQISEIKAFNE